MPRRSGRQSAPDHRGTARFRHAQARAPPTATPRPACTVAAPWSAAVRAASSSSHQYHALQQDSGTRRAPQRLLARATEGYVAGVVSLEAIARLRGTRTEAVAEDFAAAGIAPREAAVVWADLSERPPVEDDFSDLDVLDAADVP